MTTDRTTFLSVKELATAKQHVNAVLASGVLHQDERTHMVELRTRIDEAITRKNREEPRPLRGPADVPPPERRRRAPRRSRGLRLPGQD